MSAQAMSEGTTEQLRRQLEAEAAAWRRGVDQGRGDTGLLDKAQLGELAAWLTADARRELGISDVAASYIAASETAANRLGWPGHGSKGTVLAILLMLVLLATPIILLSIVVLAASVIHRIG